MSKLSVTKKAYKQMQMVGYPLYTVHEIAQAISVSDTTVRKWIKIGILEAIELPYKNGRKTYRITGKAVHNMVDQARVPPHSPSERIDKSECSQNVRSFKQP